MAFINAIWNTRFSTDIAVIMAEYHRIVYHNTYGCQVRARVRKAIEDSK